MSNCDFVVIPSGILGQVWYLNVLIPDLWYLSYFDTNAYKLQASQNEEVVVSGHACLTALDFSVKAKENNTRFLRCTSSSYLCSIKTAYKAIN